MNFKIEGLLLDSNGKEINLESVIHILDHLSEVVFIEDFKLFKPDVESSLAPNTILHIEPKLDVYTKIKKKEIHIYLGLIKLIASLGEVESYIWHAIRNNSRHEDIYNYDFDNIGDNIGSLLLDLYRGYINNDKTLIFDPPNISQFTLDTSLMYIYGHELSHYLDDYFDYEQRGKDQLKMFKYTIDYMGYWKKAYPEAIEESFYHLMIEKGKEGSRMLQYWSEEVLADYQAYRYCLGTLGIKSGDSKLFTQLHVAINITFLSIRLIDFMMQYLFNLDKRIIDYPPSSLRTGILGYTAFNEIYSLEYKEYKEFLNKEWGIFISSDLIALKVLDSVYKAVVNKAQNGNVS